MNLIYIDNNHISLIYIDNKQMSLAGLSYTFQPIFLTYVHMHKYNSL